MLRITENKDEIIIRTVPIKEWIIASIITLVFISVVSVWLFYGANSSGLVWLIYFSVFLCVMLLFFLNEATSVKINKSGKTVSIRKQNLFKYSFEVFSFNEIADPIYIDSKLVGRKGNEKTAYQTILPLKSGNLVELSIHSGLKDYEYFDLIDKMNSYIFDTSKQIPFKLTIFEDN
jgi:hypothetical protein